MAIDRAETVKKAEKMLRQGRLDLAIAEYVRMVEDQPRDLNTRNALGDLYVRAGEPDLAAAQYRQIADHILSEGFLPKAAALYKKILKIKPDDEIVQLHLADISARQGLLADAKAYLVAVAGKRQARGDRAGADEIVVRLGALDPGDFEARGLAAQTLAQSGEEIGAAIQYRSMHADLSEKGRPEEALAALREAVRLNPEDVEGRVELARAAIEQGDFDTATMYLDRASASEHPPMLWLLLELELRSGSVEAAREVLAQLLNVDSPERPRVVELAWRLLSVSADAAYVCVEAAADSAVANGNYGEAAAALSEFVDRVPGQVAALLKLIDISVDGGLDAVVSKAQTQLADAYLDGGHGAEARVIAEDLVAREPEQQAHVDRLRRALVLLDVPDPDAVIADRLNNQNALASSDSFVSPDAFEDPAPAEGDCVEAGSETGAAAATDAEAEPEPDIPLRRRAPEPTVTIVETTPAPADVDTEPTVETNLTDVLAELEGIAAAPALAPKPEAAFDEFRAHVSKQSDASDAAGHLALARTYLEVGMGDEAIRALTAAARAPGCRFEAASLLARLYIKRNDPTRAIEWFERAADAPAPGVAQARELLYDLGVLLEASGETARALAVFLELQADAAGYRDVPSRVERLARVQAGD